MPELHFSITGFLVNAYTLRSYWHVNVDVNLDLYST